jgi:hypothetical protein
MAKMESSPDQKIESELLGNLNTYNPEETKQKRLSLSETDQVLSRLAEAKFTDKATATRAVAELIRKGASNARAKDTMFVEIKCGKTGAPIEISRYDVVNCLFAICKHKTIRKLAEAMAPQLLKANLSIIQRVPTADLKGDLASVVNKNLLIAHRQSKDKDASPPTLLTRPEEICACTYAQWMPNLNELAGSTRLSRLLEEDLLLRKPRKAKTFQKNPQNKQDTEKPLPSNGVKGLEKGTKKTSKK